MKSFIRLLIVPFFSLMLLVQTGFAFPNLERPNNDALKPLDFGLTSQSASIVVSPDDRFIVVNVNENINIIDTADWELAAEQPEELTASTDGYEFLLNSSSLFVYQSDGMITRILGDDPLNDLLVVDVSADTGTGTGPLIIDSEIADSQLYFLNTNSDTIFQYSIVNQDIVTMTAFEENSVNDIAFIALPADVGGNTGGELDKIIATTDESEVVFLDENINIVATVPLSGTNPNCPSSTGNHVLTAVAVNPQRNLSYVINVTDNVIHVVDNITQAEIDADPTQTGINPICFHQDSGGVDEDINTNLGDLVVIRVNNPLNLTFGYVTGDDGVTVFRAENPFGFEDIDPSTNAIDSIPLSRDANHISASSQEDGYVYTTNSDNSISVISENPFLTISAANPATVNEGAPTFTLTFQSDFVCEGCEYRIRANGDIQESGTLLMTTTFSAADQANTDIGTPTIDINAFPDGTFIEGDNQIFIFADDNNGNTGRDSFTVSVDRPPPDVTILETNFGNERGFVSIQRLTEDDIAQYNVFVLQAIDQANPTCPGGLDFEAVAAPTLTVAQPDGGDNVKITIDELTNGTAFCVAIEAEDETGNTSANRVVAADPIIPDETVGITGASGENGCNLSHGEKKISKSYLALILLLPLLFSASKRFRFSLFLLFFLSLSFSSNLHAVEATDQHWTAQFQGGFFLPTDDVLDQFLGKCCNGMYQLTFGRIFKDKYEVNLGVGLMSEGGTAIGINNGLPSGEDFNFTVVPISNSFVYRADFVENQLFVPYGGAGFDYMYFRENVQGDVTEGVKFGYHAMAGVQILLEFFDQTADALEAEGINDVFLTLEGKWNQIDNFGGAGLAFNGFTFSAGLLFAF